MIKKNVFRKSLVIGIIILFVSLAIAPGAYAIVGGSNTARQKTTSFNIYRGELKTELSSDEDVVEILVTKHKPDGGVEKTIVSLPRERLDELVEELKEARVPEEKLSIYKRYELIPQNFKVEQLKTSMLQKSHNVGLIQKKMVKLNMLARYFKNVFSVNTSFNANCSVSGEVTQGMKYLIGLSAFTGFINFVLKMWYMNNRIQSFDLLNVFVAEKGKIDAVNGSSPDIHTGEDRFLIAGILGFSGYIIIFPPIPGILLWGQFFGYAAFVAVIWSETNV